MSSWSSMTRPNVVLGQLGRSKCCLGAARHVQMSSWSSWTGRNVVLEQLGRPERRERPRWFRKDPKALKPTPEKRLLRRARKRPLLCRECPFGTGKLILRRRGPNGSSRNDVLEQLEQLDKSKCRPGAAGHVEMLSWSSWASRNVVLEQQDTSKCRAGAAGTPDRKKQLLGRARKRPLLCRECPFGTVKLILSRQGDFCVYVRIVAASYLTKTVVWRNKSAATAAKRKGKAIILLKRLTCCKR